MKTLPKNAKAAKICHSWAADFKQRNELEEAGFWHSISLGLESGAEINSDAFERLKADVSERAQSGKYLADILATQGDHSATNVIKDTLLELSQEAEFVKNILG